MKMEEYNHPGECNWKQSIQDMLQELIRTYELPAGSLYVKDHNGQTERTKNTLISHAVCIWEPEYPPVPDEKPGQNKTVVTIVPSRVKNRPDDLELNLRKEQERALQEYLPSDAKLMDQTKSDQDTGMVRVRIKKTSPGLTEYIRRNAMYCINGYASKASKFGCCGFFEKCSDAGRCIHENRLYATACLYRGNLEKGRIFYGKNRNID
ncbi:MAG: hypothetical protein IJI38_09305 [Clostridia bacterium]|nr:hypothetical protein [Clostridia bacterium]